MTVVLCDVNETLLDLRGLDEEFERAFGDAAVRREWFTQVLQSALVSTVVGSYVDFGTVGTAALDMVAERHDCDLSGAQRRAIVERMRHLPPHEDALPALERLRDAGSVRLGALTNSTQATAQAQLENAGLARYFEQILSADTVRRLKPAAEVYRHAADAFHADRDEVLLVAAHAWDVAGAMAAGCRGAFVARPGMVLDPLFPQPDIVAADLVEITAHVLGEGG